MSTKLPPHCIASFPDEAELQRRLDEMNRATEKIAAERERMNAGSRIARAVRARQRPCITAIASTAARADETFSEKLKREVAKRSGAKQREERAAKERDEYNRRHGFGSHVAQAVKRKISARSRSAAVAAPRAEAESFAQKITEAVRRRLPNRKPPLPQADKLIEMLCLASCAFRKQRRHRQLQCNVSSPLQVGETC